jgi:hypothetical protein
MNLAEHMTKAALFALPLLALSSGTLPAQHSTSALEVNARVRIHACEVRDNYPAHRLQTYVGDVVHSDTSAVIVSTASARLATIPVAHIKVAYVSIGRRSRLGGTFRGLLLGTAVGLALGYGLDAINVNRSGDGSGEAFESILLPFFGATAVGSIGALIGFASAGEQWRPVPNSHGAGSWCS